MNGAEEGDIYNEETGKHIGAIDTNDLSTTINLFPLEISVLFQGQWFIYKLDRREANEESTAEEAITSDQEEIPEKDTFNNL